MMADIKDGDRVRIKDRSDWPMPAGYHLAGSKATVVEVMDEPEGYVMVLFDGDFAGIDKSIPLAFRVEAVEKMS